MHALIDADILVYRIGFTTQELSEGIASARLRESIEGILFAVDANDVDLFITSQDKSNFRYSIDANYKANRKDFVRPIHYDFLRDTLLNDWNATEVFGMEADDALGIHQDESTIICSIDKDLDQIPGWHFNFVKGLKYEVSEEEGIRNFYTQLLMGDRTDNVQGIDGIGPKKAAKILTGTSGTPEYVLYNRVAREYEIAHGTKGQDLLVRNANLLFIRRKGRNQWEPPTDDLAWRIE